jgi:prophage maintenance system killer protein
MSMNQFDQQIRVTPGAVETMVRGGMAASTSVKSSPILPKIIVQTFPYTIAIPESPYGDRRVFCTGSNELYVYDGTHHVRAIVLDKEFYSAKIVGIENIRTASTFVQVNGYITSQANLDQDEPTLCLTAIEILRAKSLRVKTIVRSDKSIVGTTLLGTEPPTGEPYRLTQGRVMGGKIADFLLNIAPFLSYEALSGCYKEQATSLGMTADKSTGSATDDTDDTFTYNDNDCWKHTSRKLQIVSNFLSRHQAMVTLANSSTISETTAGLPTPVALHKSMLESFVLSQMDRQKASLSSNVARAQASLATQIVQQHHEVLDQMIKNKHPWMNPATDDINLAMLNWCHSKLCQGLIPDAGMLRTKTVRVGTTSFVHNGNIEDIVSQLLSSLHTLRIRLMHQFYQRTQLPVGGVTTFAAATTAAALSQKHQQQRKDNESFNRTVEQQQLLASLTYAAAVFMGLIDTHSYSDGNGRLSRIVVNWVLHHQIHNPFVINFFATPSQRAEYASAICRTRRNICLVPCGNVPDDLLLEAYERVGALSPMVELILDRLYKVVAEFKKLSLDKISSHTEQEQERAARKFRERAATGTCQICFDANPNIATLCCGNAVHLNCIAQWLSSNSSCPQCRSEIPRLERRNVNVDELSDDAIQRLMLTNLGPMLDQFRRDYDMENGNGATVDDFFTESINDTEEVEDDEIVSTEERSQFCANCHLNRAAVECANSLCGRCCGTHGEEYCFRHSSS